MVPLLTASHRVIRIDLLGHGRSDKPADGDYEITAQARRVAGALDRLGVEHVIVVGHSSGGNAATALAEQRPDLVTALALINTGPHMKALIATPEGAIEPSQWPHLTDEQLRQAASTGFSRPGYQPRHNSSPPTTTPSRARMLRCCPGSGHSPHLEDPPRTAAPLLAFTATLATQIDRTTR